ncbi:Outer membrane protein beta-barrel domain-containing protein [Muriicola jejuensis]|uniref:Outer membrane beta-barrel protein n=1 Tax=Muriicola jejuensis TaxID=504488 RepID=A0A6P0U9D2_9FLAO|nr:outer membrane beta-barrel protein [Muriicola jejuensis]NER09835.1 outer membrane beta-barrel protein [Muriicola jejuensis]SMP05323.1 Outer membrane protein beta-barrel domain-containing protein [Muriicola jejuensis]
MRKQLLFPFLFVLFGYTLSAQDEAWSIETSYPVSVGNEFANDGRGILDLGVQYRFAEVGRLKLGGSFNTSLFASRTQFTTGSANGEMEYDFRQSDLFIQPRFFLETETPGIEKLRWSLGVGYSWQRYKAKGTFMSEPLDGSDTRGGFNLNVGASMDVFRDWFLKVQFDHIAIPGDFYGNASLLKMGIGVRF